MPQRKRRFGGMVMMIGAGIVGGIILHLTTTATAYPRYRQSDAGGYCVTCHGDFDGPISPTGAVFPSNSKHEMHRGSQNMNTDCGLCHVQNGDNPMMASSAGGPNNPIGYGCIGCHGQDLGSGVISGAGLRAHHLQAGVNACLTCHPADPTPLPERFPPPYYGTGDTNAGDPCNMAPGFLENWTIGDTLGLDNDGDGLYDMNDGDCSCPADSDGNGTVNIVDLLGLLSAWGGSDPTFDFAPFPGDGIVNISDLLDMLGGWGACP